MKFSTHIAEFEPPIPNPQPFIDKSLSLYDYIVKTGKGKIVFLVGELGRGKSSIMRSFEKTFRKARPVCSVRTGSFIRGELCPFIPDTDFDFIQTIDTMGNIASFLKFFSPRAEAALDLGGQFAQTFSSNLALKKAHTASPPSTPVTSFSWISEIRELAKEKPLVCIIDDFDESAEQFIWNEFLLNLAEEIAADKLPVLFLVSLTGKFEPEEIENDEFTSSLVLDIKRELIGRGLAEQWHIEPMSCEDISDWIILDVAKDVVRQLHEVTGGNPRWVQILWREWRVNENVFFNEYQQKWQWTKDKSPELGNPNKSFEDLLKILLNTTDLSEIRKAKRILGTAALEGRTFTANVLASALKKDTNEIIDYLDDNFVFEESRPNGILLDIGFAEIDDGEKSLCQYKFASDWHWKILDHYTFPTYEEKSKYAKDVVRALENVFESNENFIAKSLVRLYEILKDGKAVRWYKELADFLMSRRLTREYALALLNVDITEWDNFRCRQSALFMLKAGDTINDENPYEALQIFEKAVEMSEKSLDRELHATALHSVGWSYINFGRIENAKEKAESGLKIIENIKDKILQGKYYTLMGKIKKTQREYAEAAIFYEKCVEISEQVAGKDHRNTAIAYDNLSIIYQYLKDFEKAEKFVIKAIKIFERQKEIRLTC